MTFKFTLTDEANTIKVISDPSGWDTASIGFSRDQKWWGLDEIFKSSFLTYGDARAWIISREKLFGPDGLLSVLVEVDPNDDEEFEFFYSGQIPIGLIIETLGSDGHLLQINFTQADFWTRFKTRIASPVDIRSTVDMDGNTITATPKFTLPLPSQIIIKKYSGTRLKNAYIFPTNDPVWIFGFDSEPLKEIQEQSNLTPSLFPQTGTYPKYYKNIIPFFNFADDGILTITKLKIIVGAGFGANDANYSSSNDFELAKNQKGGAGGVLIMNIQINNNNLIPLTRTNIPIPSTYVRNDGIVVTNAFTHLYQFELPTPISINIKKTDFLRIVGDNSTNTGGVYLFGSEGWDHYAGADAIYNSQGATAASTSGIPKNARHICYGGIFDASLNIFPSTIDNDDGAGQPIKAGNFWNIGSNGTLGGVVVNDKMVIRAKVDNPANVIADWDITTLTLFEGLEAWGFDNGFECTFNTTAIDTNTEAFLTHDIAAGICDRITGQSGLFYSDYFGNQHTSRIYPAIGCGSQLAKMKGLHLRGYRLAGDPDATKNKPYFSSMQDWVEEEYPVHFIGMGYEKKVIDSVEQDIIRCEPLNHFFPDGDPVVSLSNVFFIKRSYDPDHQFNSVKIGHAKWQSQAATGVGTPSGIDDAQTVHTYTPRFKKIGKAIEFLSKMIMASLTLETTRRVGNLLSANYTYDNDTFGIAVVRNVDDDGYTPELDENFSSITNLSNSETRYNSRYTPARNFLRGLNYVSGCLQNYLTSLWKFASGEGNYVMTSTMTTDCPGDDSGESVAENGDIPVSSTPLFVPMPYEIDHELTWEQYKTLRANKYLPIGISQTEENYKKFYIKSCERIVGTGLFKIIAWPKTLDDAFDIVVDESSGQSGSARRHESRFEPRYD